MRKVTDIRTIFISIRILTVLCLLLCHTAYLPAQTKDNPEDSYISRVKHEFDKENWEAGKKIAEEGLKDSPNDSYLRMLLGKYYFHKKQYNQARYELKKALEKNKDNVEAKQILVNVEMASERYSSAICYVNELLEVNPYWRGLWRKKIELYRLQGNTVEANRLFKRISQIYPEDTVLQKDYVYGLEMEALESQKKGKTDEAIALRMELLKNDPKNPEHYIEIANSHIKAGDFQQALSYIERGLSHTPDNHTLIEKKISLLADQKQYNQLLSYLQKQKSPAFQAQYNYYLSEAARDARESDPVTLYGKILERNPGDEEAFNYVFTYLYGAGQYEEALHITGKYRKAKGESKNILMKELSVYIKLGNRGKARRLMQQLLTKYPDDYDLKETYAKQLFEEAKEKISEENYSGAVTDLKEALVYAESETAEELNNALYSATMLQKDYEAALEIIRDMIVSAPQLPELYVKRADTHQKMKQYDKALADYETAVSMAAEKEKAILLEGYSEMIIPIIKDLNESYRYKESMEYIKKWLANDPSNIEAITHAVNLSYRMNKNQDAYTYARQGSKLHPDNLFFRIKMAEEEMAQTKNYHTVYHLLSEELEKEPYHKDLINTFTQATEKYGRQLIKEKKFTETLDVLNRGLRYAPADRTMKYLKGIAYEKMNRFDSAFYYQSFYDPAVIEAAEFRQHLKYLQYRGFPNEVGIYHLYSRHGDQDVLNTVSTIEYSRRQNKNVYTGRVNYSGRETGKGYQLQAEWTKIWNESTYTKVDAAWATRFFPKIAINASVYKDIKPLGGLEAEIGIGYKRLPGKENLSNLKLGCSKELDTWRLNVIFNNFLLSNSVDNGLKKNKWLYSLSGQARYHWDSPKNYLMGMAGVGTSPDVDLINFQLYEGFSKVNTMVGAGMGYLIFKNVSAGVIGTWYNYSVNENKYKNLYTVYLHANITF